ncbi:pyruvate formate-lyase-activating protein [Bacillaceae bacterium S4-13-58]
MKGRIHSVETCGTVDGPGIRFVVFTQGCPLRCLYCHNPDTWDKSGGKEVTIDSLMNEISSYLPFIRASKGGITVSGGEPLMQPEFVLALFKACKEKGIHTALDTSGAIIPPQMDEILDVCDLVLLDIKHIESDMQKNITGLGNKNTMKLLSKLREKSINVWIRHVLVPGLTLDKTSLNKLGEYLGEYSNVKRIDLLPYHKMGEYKWEALGLNNTLAFVKSPSKQDVEQAYDWVNQAMAKKQREIS